jgi:hypothetical protein
MHGAIQLKWVAPTAAGNSSPQLTGRSNPMCSAQTKAIWSSSGVAIMKPASARSADAKEECSALSLRDVGVSDHERESLEINI